MTPIFIAGPCVIESADLLDEVACELVRIKQKFNIEIYFKASFDKANRTSVHSYWRRVCRCWVTCVRSTALNF